MRYCVDYFEYDGKKIFCKGWALPEHQGDTLKVYLRDNADKHEIPVKVQMEERPDAELAMYGKEGHHLYGFIINYETDDDRELELYFDAVEFDIDYARKTLRVKEAMAQYKKQRRHRK